ncbi:MAG: T9SS type A sorting domain-containing protein [Saprospiraceae bacterium]|nr:T9SS type A sorting domain-containing protein [Saprospiraceae bacterium]
MQYSKFNILFVILLMVVPSRAQIPAFPGAEGFGAATTGGRGGRVIYVTNLNPDGPGSLQAALNETGKRYILFKVSGVIPATMEVLPGHGDFTLAGQTSPGGVIVRGFQSYAEENPSSGNFIVRHIRSRIGDLNVYPSSNWVGADGLTLGGVHKAIIDHCSFAHASDEAVDISRSSSLTIQNSLLAETLGGHSDLGGMLINYSSSNSRLDSLSIHHNTWHRIGGRMPEISCETQYCGGQTIKLEISNNLFWDPQIEMWYEGVTGQPGASFNLQMNAVNNLSFARPGFGNGMFHIDMLYPQNNSLFFQGNQLNLYPDYSDYDLFYCCNDFPDNNPNHQTGAAQIRNERWPYPSIGYTAAEDLTQYMAAHVGAFPRDAMDLRLTSSLGNETIDPSTINEDHYGDAFTIVAEIAGTIDSDNDGMPDYWESRKGLNPNAADHNGNDLSVEVTGVQGYTNLECYLNCLSDYLVSGESSSPCAVAVSTKTDEKKSNSIQIFPNPGYESIWIQMPEISSPIVLSLIDNMGRRILTRQCTSEVEQLEVSHLLPGFYTILITNNNTTYSQCWVKAR